MNDMVELVIKIDEDVFARLFDNGIQDNEISVDDICEMARALRKGTPLEEEFEKLKEEIQKYITENKNSEDLYLAGCGDGAYHALAILNRNIKENNCNTCTHKGYDCDNDYWVDCEQYDKEDKE